MSDVTQEQVDALQARLEAMCTQLGIVCPFNVNGPGDNQGTVFISVGEWPYDYTVSLETLNATLDPKKLILAALRASVP